MSLAQIRRQQRRLNAAAETRNRRAEMRERRAHEPLLLGGVRCSCGCTYQKKEN